jgi:N-acetylglutamate synthase-like GNAT family acetyltransferase
MSEESNKTIIIRSPNSDRELEAMYDLRWRVLREPWNQPRDSEKDEMEEESFRFIVILDNKIVATARFHKNNESEGQIRYLAVEEEYRRQGIALKLMYYIEGLAIKLRISSIILNARQTAQDLFKKLEYKILKEGHLLFGEIPHFVMWKKLIYDH